MPDFFRCPYCVEGLGFKVMIAQAERNGYACARCGHFVRPQDQLFLCTCVKCIDLQRPAGAGGQ